MPVDTLAQNCPSVPLYRHDAFVVGQPVRYAPPFADMPYAGCSGQVTTIIGHSAIVCFDTGGAATVDQRNLRAWEAEPLLITTAPWWDLPKPEPVGSIDYAHRRRHPGCQSNNHTHCFGDLWTCSCCGKTVCANEGFAGDDHCDDCWMLGRKLDQVAAMVVALMGPDTYAHFRQVAEGQAGHA